MLKHGAEDTSLQAVVMLDRFVTTPGRPSPSNLSAALSESAADSRASKVDG